MAEQNPFEQPDANSASAVDAKETNYFAQFDNSPSAGDPGLLERARLNSVDAFYRGTIQGSLSLRSMAERVKNPPARETDPVRLAELGALGATPYDPDQERSEYEKIVADLARHDAMKSWGSTLEGAAALGGQLAGSLLTPENLFFLPGRGATVLARIARGALEGAAVNVVTDPVVQSLNVGVAQKEYDPLRTALAAPLGAVVGGGLVGAGELISKTFLRKKIADLATEDPSFRSADMDAAEASAPRPQVENYSPGIAALGLDDGKAKRLEWASASTFRTVDDLLAAAPENQRGLATAGQEISDLVGVQFVDPGVKGRARLEEKVTQGRAPGAITDVSRAAFVVERPDQGEQVVAELAKRYELIDEGWFVTPVGYFDRKVILRFPDGMLGEIQLLEPTMQAVKQGAGHALYERARSLEPKDPQLAELNRQMMEIYGAATEGLPDAWKATLGTAGRPGNLAENVSAGSTAPPMPTSAELTSTQVPDLNTQASPGSQANGSPSKIPNLGSIVNNIDVAERAGKPALPGEPESLIGDIERLRTEANAAFDRGDNEAVDEFLRAWEGLRRRLDEIAPDRTAEADRSREAAPPAAIPSEISNGIRVFSPSELGVDAERFQFKGGGDAEGVTDRLKGVTRWDPVKAGVIIVWEDAQGKFWIADGHQRLGLAKRIAQDDPAQRPALNAFLLREADGVSDAEVRVIAAAKNIAEGTGTAVDAAKILRDRPDLISDLPPRSELVRQATDLANLDPEAFRMVINEIVPPHYAAVVGRLVPEDARLQRALLDLLAKTEPANLVQAEAIVRQGRETGLHVERQNTLFGEEDIATSLFAERAKVLDRALKQLKRDKTIFSTLVREQDIVTEAGNVLAADVNARRAQADAQVIQVLQVLANRKGPISDALNEAARKAKDGKISDAVAGFIDAVRREAESGDLARLADGGARGDVEAARAGAASPRDAERAGRDLEAAIRGRKPDPRQGDIFGGAKASQGDLAQRGADAPIRPTKAQEPLDFGLFGDTAGQADLVDRARGGERSLSHIALRRARERTAEAAKAADQSKFITFMRERFGEGWTVEKVGKPEYEAAVRQFIDENPGAAGNMVGFMLTQPRGRKADSGGPERAIFAGENALGADREKLAEAKRIEKELAGGPVTDGNLLVRDLIWFKTGWFRGTDGKWRFEIPDTNLIVLRAAESGDVPTTQSKVISHDALFENYPTLLDGIARWFQSADRNHGMFTPGSMIEAYGSDYFGLLSVTAHELQHAVQTAKGFARGGSPDEFKGILSSLNPERAKELAYEAYRRLAGETEARNVQARLFLTDQERSARPPYRTEDIDRSKQMVMRPDQVLPGRGESEELALAVRKGGGQLAMERARPDAGIPSQVKTGTLATVPDAPSPKDVAIQSLQQQAFALADAIGFPLRQGRNKAGTLATFNTSSGVVRTKEIADFEVVVHEAGHAIEAKVGQDLTDLTSLHAYELGPLDYDHTRASVAEGFAEWVRRYIGNPKHAEQVAPGFTKDFRLMMGAEHPELLRAIDDAGKSYRAYLDAPSVDAVGAVVRSKAERQTGWRGVMQRIRTDGMPTVIKTAMQRAYEDVFDDKAPVTRAMRDLARAIRDQEGMVVDLKAADNPEVLLRMFERSHQAAVRDMMDGVRGYHSVNPEGPSLSAALEKATGGVNSGGWGKWDPEKIDAFSTYLIARRAIGLWDKFSAGSLQNPPSAFSRADAVVAISEFEKANPAFREASDMVHDWTRRLLKKQFDGGLIDADLFGRLMQEQFYVPFMRDLSDRPLSGSGAVSGAPDQVADTVKRMRGSTRDIISPIESLMTQAFLVNRTLAHNDIIRAFVRFAERAGTEGGRFVEKIPASEARNYSFDLSASVERLARERGVPADDIRFVTGALSDLFGEDPVVGSFFRMEPAGKRGEPIIFYKEGGETRAARFMSLEEGHALYEVLTALPKPLTDMWSMMIGSTTSLLRAGITTNPMFALTNYIRDQMAVAILRPDYIPVVSGMRGFVQEIGQGEHAVLYGYAGGVSGGASISPVERAVEADINALAKKGYLVNRVTSLKGALELASVTESATRNSVFGKVYEAKKKEGLSDYEAMIEAAFQAQDILDFSRHGSRTDSIRKFVPFINSYFQGMDKARRTIVEPMVRKFRDGDVFAGDQAAFNNALLAATKVFGVGGVLGAGWAALHADSEAYRDASPQVKGTHVVVPFGRNIILWPKPFELGIGFTAGEYAYQMLSQNDPRAAEQFAKAAWDSLTSSSPIYDIPLVKTAFELKSGKNLFTGRDIVPSTLQRLAPEQQYTDRTSSVAKWLGAQIGVSPIKVDYTIGSLFGLWGRDIMAMSSGVDPDAPAQSWEDRVFVRRLIKDPARTSDVTTKFWDFMGQTTGKYNQNVATYDDMVKKFRDDQAAEFLAKLPASEKAFVIMKSAAKDDGKPAFSSDEKRIHPLQRAYDAVTMLNGIRRELTDNAFKTFEGENRPPLDPVTRRDLIENVRELAQKEMRNSFVIMKEPGYAGRPLFDLASTMDKIRAISTDVADEIVTRYATAKIQKTTDVAKVYQSIRDALIRNGSEADLGDFVTGEYEFGGDRVKKPQKRRVKITPQ